MKTIKISLVLIVAFLMIGSINGYSQKKGGQKEGHSKGKSKGNPKKVMVVKGHHKQNGVVKVKSKYRPSKMMVYHPHWAPKHSYNHRWVYFPRHNFYWDNWRQVYVYRNGTVWINNPKPPAVIVNINLANEKNYELREDDDDMDDVYNTNDNHKKEYKPD